MGSSPAGDLVQTEELLNATTTLGVGAGHREATEQHARPYEALARYVDVLEAGGVPRGSLVLAALGTKVLGLARDRAAGAIPYLVPPEHTRHLDAGADHVCLHLITEEGTDPLPGYRALALALGLS